MALSEGSLDTKNKDGNTPLHYCALHDKVECMRLLLRSKANPFIENNMGKYPETIAIERKNSKCQELLSNCKSHNSQSHLSHGICRQFQFDPTKEQVGKLLEKSHGRIERTKKLLEITHSNNMRSKSTFYL